MCKLKTHIATGFIALLLMLISVNTVYADISNSGGDLTLHLSVLAILCFSIFVFAFLSFIVLNIIKFKRNRKKKITGDGEA